DGAPDSRSDENSNHVLIAGRFAQLQLPIQPCMDIVDYADLTIRYIVEDLLEIETRKVRNVGGGRDNAALLIDGPGETDADCRQLDVLFWVFDQTADGLC